MKQRTLSWRTLHLVRWRVQCDGKLEGVPARRRQQNLLSGIGPTSVGLSASWKETGKNRRRWWWWCFTYISLSNDLTLLLHALASIAPHCWRKHARTHTYVRTHAHAHTRAHTDARMRARAHTHTHTHTHTPHTHNTRKHKHTQTQVVRGPKFCQICAANCGIV